MMPTYAILGTEVNAYFETKAACLMTSIRNAQIDQ